MEVERGLLVELLGSPRCGFALTGPDRPSKYVKLCLPNSGCTRNDTDPRLKLGFRGWISVRLCMQGGIDGSISGDPTRSHMMHKTCKSQSQAFTGFRASGNVLDESSCPGTDLVFISSSGNKVPGHLHLLSLFSSSFTEVLLDLEIEAGAITALSLPFPSSTLQAFYR